MAERHWQSNKDEHEGYLGDSRAADISVFDHDIESQQVELIYRQAPVAIGAALILTLLVTAGLWSIADHRQLLIWLTAHIVQSSLRMLLVRRYQTANEQQRQRPIWMLLYFIGAFIGGLAWGCLGLIFSFAWPVEFQTLTLMSIAGVLAGAISSYAVNMSVYIAFMVPAILIPAQSMLIYTDKLQNNLGLMLMLFAAGLLMFARNYNVHAVQLLQLRQVNDNLLQGMRKTNLELEHEIDERSVIEQDLRDEQRMFANGPVVMFRCRAEAGWRIEYISETVDQFGYDAAELMRNGTDYVELIHPADRTRVEETEFFYGRNGLRSLSVDYQLLGADGSIFWVFDYTTPVYDSSGRMTHFMGYLLDITERKNAEYELTKAKERAQVTLHSIADAVITTDVNGQVEYMNPSAEALTGWELMVARGVPVSRVFRICEPGNDKQANGVVIADDPVMRCLLHARTVESESDCVIRRNDDEMLSIRYAISPILATPGNPIGAILVFHDVTPARRLERTITYQATHDSLTGLWNRSEFENQVGQAVTSARQAGETHVVCSMDIDQLKVINETCSHEAGDQLLCRIAELLQGSLRDTDTVARLGGDEFGVLMRNCTLVSAARVIEEVMIALHALRFSNEGRVFEISASIGVTQVNAESETATHVMSEADLACHAAKERGGNRYHIFQVNDADLQCRLDQMQWVSRISEAIDSDRLVLFCQEIRALGASAGQGLHVEILLRMRDTDGTLVLPDRFLPAAERYNLIAGLDSWVVSHTLAWYADYISAGHNSTDDMLSINLSGMSITNAKVLSNIKTEIRRYGVPAEVLCFEITETAAISNLSAAGNFIRELRRLGCRFALDDFGSGLSSFSYLKNLPVDFLKIDGTFVRNMDTDPVDFAMVSAIQQLGTALGTRTIAEFVRNEAILRMLAELGVDYGQGYAIAPPQPLDDFLNASRQQA